LIAVQDEDASKVDRLPDFEVLKKRVVPGRHEFDSTFKVAIPTPPPTTSKLTG
jgi:hypothetical protein